MSADSVQKYIENFSGEARERLEIIDKLIKSLSDKITSKISWSMPTYVLHNPILQVCAFKKHIGLYPGAAAVDAFRNRLEKEGYTFSKGGIQLPLSRDLPIELIKEITKFNITADEQESKGVKSVSITRPEKELPEGLLAKLISNDLLEVYNKRPRYQRTDYISWIEKAVRAETKEKRTAQMIEELKNGDAYMGMAYNAKS